MVDEESLTERQLYERLSIATQAAGIFVWELDWAAQQISWDQNAAALAMGNRHYGRELGADLFKWVHPEDTNIGHTAMAKALAAGKADASFRYRLQFADGTVRHIQAYARTSTDASGQPLRSLGVSWDVTEEVEATEQLRRNADQERKLLDHLSIATHAAGIECWEYDYTLEKMTWLHGVNEEFAEPGVDAAEIGRRALASVLPEDSEAVRIATQRAIDEGDSSMTMRMRRRRPNGQIRHLQLYQRFVRDEQGRPIRALGATRDITVEVEATERFRAHAEALRDAQRRLERATLSVAEGHFEMELLTGKHWASSSYYALLGYRPDELKLDTIEAVDVLIHPDDLFAAREFNLRHRDLGIPYVHEMRVRHKDGSFRWFLVRAQVEQDAAGTPIRFCGSIQDIHRQRLTEDALKAARERFDRAIRGTQDGLWEWDLLKPSLWVSPRYEAILGFAEGEISGTVDSPERLIHPEDLDAHRSAQRAHFEGTAPYDFEVRMRTKSGDHRWVRVRGEADRDQAGNPLRLAGSMQDVTEARSARDALIAASEAAQSANRLKSVFLANVSHEIRTPMNGIIGMTSLLLDSTLDAPQREYAETIHASANSLLTVINDILDFSKIEAGRLDIESIELDLPESIEEARAMLSYQAAAKSLRLVAIVQPDVPRWVIGDRQRIRQCLINLLSNAVKFTHSGTVTVEVSIVGRRDGGALARFEVRDTGIGIAPDTMPTLFQPFVQADSSTTRHFGGTGLGLSIVRRLVELMGGELGVDSELGRGSTFWFLLPLKIASPDAVRGLPATDAPPANARFAERYRGSVLLVEDNVVNQKVARSFLERMGCVVTLANNGLEAVHAYAQGSFDLVLLDLQMPLMDGFAATSCIRKLEQGRTRTPIVALTASAMTGQRERCIEAGMDDLIAKPLDVQRLRTVLDRLGMRAAAEAGGATPAASDLHDGSTEPAALATLVAGVATDSPIDARAFADLTGDDCEFARELASTFLYTSEEILASVSECARRGDRAGIARLTHSLKGASANIYAATLRQLCADLEAQVAELDEVQLLQHVARLAAERQRVVAALERLASDAPRAARSR